MKFWKVGRTFVERNIKFLKAILMEMVEIEERKKTFSFYYGLCFSYSTACDYKNNPKVKQNIIYRENPILNKCENMVMCKTKYWRLKS